MKLDIRNRRGWLRDGLAVLDHAFEMKLNRFANVVFDLLDGVAGRDASWQIWNVSGKVVFASLDDYRIFFYGLPRSPA